MCVYIYIYIYIYVHMCARIREVARVPRALRDALGQLRVRGADPAPRGPRLRGHADLLHLRLRRGAGGVPGVRRLPAGLLRLRATRPVGDAAAGRPRRLIRGAAAARPGAARRGLCREPGLVAPGEARAVLRAGSGRGLPPPRPDAAGGGRRDPRGDPQGGRPRAGPDGRRRAARSGAGPRRAALRGAARRRRRRLARRPPPPRRRASEGGPSSFRESHLSNTTCLTHVFFKSGE